MPNQEAPEQIELQSLADYLDVMSKVVWRTENPVLPDNSIRRDLNLS